MISEVDEGIEERENSVTTWNGSSFHGHTLSKKAGYNARNGVCIAAAVNIRGVDKDSGEQ